MAAHKIYTEAQANVLCALAVRKGQLADVLNALSDGGMVTAQPDGLGGMDLVILDGGEFDTFYKHAIGESDDDR